MSRSHEFAAGFGIVLGLLFTASEGAAKPPTPPPPQCLDCPIVYAQEGQPRRIDLMLMHEDGSSKTLLLAGTREIHNRQPNWAPEGGWISFQSNRDGQTATWMIKTGGEGLTKVLPACTGGPQMWGQPWAAST